MVICRGSLVADPSIQVPGFDLPHRLWCTLNCFRTGQGRCAASLTRWQQITDPTCCDCGAPQQTIMHIVEDCPVTRFPSGLPALHLADENALIWLDTQSKRQRKKDVRLFLYTRCFPQHMSLFLVFLPSVRPDILVQCMIFLTTLNLL